MTRPPDRYRVGFDIGGTFTDFILLDGATGAIRLHKCLTTPEDPSTGRARRGSRSCCAAAGLELADIGELVHGTTLVTNAMIERQRRAARAAHHARLPRRARDGHRAALRHLRPVPAASPSRWCRARRRREVDERVSRDGSVMTPLDRAAVAREVADLVAAGVEAVAVCFLHAYAQPGPRAGGGAIAPAPSSRRWPCRCPPRWCRSCASTSATTTTSANAYVQPLMDRYLARLEGSLARARVPRPLYLMQSSGGWRSPAMARAFPIRLLESGPAGGGLATAFFGAPGRASRHDLVRHGRHHGQGVPDPGRAPRRRADDGGGARAPLQEGQRACRSRRP